MNEYQEQIYYTILSTIQKLNGKGLSITDQEKLKQALLSELSNTIDQLEDVMVLGQ